MSTIMPTMASTYGAWLISLFVETILYGIGILQVWLFFLWSHKDGWSIKLPTIQILFFFRSTYFRFVQRFGVVQNDLVWCYLSQFTVQMYEPLTRDRVKMYKTSAVGIYVVVLRALLYIRRIAAGIAQTIWTYPITTLQTVASLGCDFGITIYLCLFLTRNKNGLPNRTESMMNSLMINAVNRGMLTALCSAFTTGLFLGYPDTFWFFLPLAPNSKRATPSLNMRHHFRDKYLSNDRGLNTIQLGSIHTHVQGGTTISAVEFVKPSVEEVEEDEEDDLSPKTAEFASGGSVGSSSC
ncbi:hypothetical protein DFH09DRAFT_1147099 [Mycena vulgaris]|nr:hypothetical protein DFH09DRAFT_1147099 [Mycena vulgaris]